jgi:NADP-dependent 3-hydroxy acid dehydrogenase YdfG
MSKTIIVGGFGPGISTAVAEKFGKEGFSVALVARNVEKLSAGVAALTAKGIKSAAFPTDLGDPAAVRALVGKVRAALGPITVLHWNPYSSAAGDLLTADAAALHTTFDLAVTNLLAAVQEALPDLRKTRESAILVTNGGLAYADPQNDLAAVEWNVMGLAVANAAKLRMVGLLSQKLKKDGVYVGQVVVQGTVKGTPFDQGNATLDGATIANKFWDMYRARSEVTTQVR